MTTQRKPEPRHTAICRTVGVSLFMVGLVVAGCLIGYRDWLGAVVSFGVGFLLLFVCAGIDVALDGQESP